MTDMEMMQLIESLQRQLDQERDQTAFFSAQFEQMSTRYEALLAKMDEADKSSKSRINALIDQIVVLTEQLAYFQNQVLGSKSEQSKKGEASPEPVEACEGNDPIHSETVEIPEPSPRAPSKKKKGHKANSVKDIPVKEITIDLKDGEQNCPRCGEPMKKMGTKAVHELLIYRPATLYRISYRTTTYECRCPEPEEPKIALTAKVPAAPLQGSYAGPSVLARAFYMKFVLHVPLNRQLQEWGQYGLGVSRQTLTNWIITPSRDWLTPIYGRLHQSLLGRDLLHADETHYQILKRSDGKAATSESRIWVARTGWGAEHPVIYYHSALTRSQAEADHLLGGFKGYLQCDAYAVYPNLEGVTICACLAHIRRKFHEVSAAGAKGAAATGEAYCNKIFHIEGELKGLKADERHEKRLELVKPVLEEFYAWLKTVNAMKGKLQTAVNYALKLEKEMAAFLEDGRIQVSNNLCEQAVRPVALGRKNHLFSTSEEGAKANVKALTLIETAKANGIDPYKYLEYIFEKLPNTPFGENPELIENFLPWSTDVQEACR